MSTLELRNVSFSYGKAKKKSHSNTGETDAVNSANSALISEYNLAFESHERVALQAPSGFGKTTICRLLAGYLQPQVGEVLLDGQPLAAYRNNGKSTGSDRVQISGKRNSESKVGSTSQADRERSKLTRYHCPHGDFYAAPGEKDNNKGPISPLPVQMIWQHPEQTLDPLLRMQASLEEAGPIDEVLLDALGIKREWLTRYPRELSGGELQRCCIARALRVRPKFLIADEISTMLDAITQVQIWEFLLSYCEKNDVGLVLVTHSKALQDRLATRVVELDA